MKTAPLLIALCLSMVAGCANEDKYILVGGRINGKPARFVFDTGTSDLVLFSASAAKLALKWTNAPTNVQIPPGEVSGGTTEECTLTLGHAQSRVSFAVFELPSYLDFPADGLLGWGPLNQNTFRIDAADLVVEGIEKMPRNAASWTKLRVRTNSMYLMLEIPGAGTNVSAIFIDTGNFKGVTLSPQRWSEWKAAHFKQPKTMDSYYMPAAGVVAKEEAWARELDFGPLRLTEVPVTEANQAQLSLGGEGCEAWLGLAALKQFDFIVDGKNGFAYFHPKQGPRAPYQHNRAGAVFVPADPQSDDLVAHVSEGSPAFEAGVRDGDILLKVDGSDVTKWRTETNAKPNGALQRPAGTKLVLTLKRGSKVLTKTVVLRDILGPDKDGKSP